MSKAEIRSYDRSVDGDLPLIFPILVTALFWALEAIGSETPTVVYQYSLCALMSSIILPMLVYDIQVARFLVIHMVLAPAALSGSAGMRSLLFGFLSFGISGALIGFARKRSEKKRKHLLAKPFLWILLAWYVMVGVSLIPFTVVTFGLPRESWWVVIALYGLAGYSVRWLGRLDIVGGLLYGTGICLLSQFFLPFLAVWAYSTNLVVIYFGLLIPSIRKILT